jgi:cytosine/adenosine deaminase-related metal-dependent hydrolase
VIGELGQLSVGAVADIAVWSLTGLAFAGAISDPIEAWLRCGPLAARHTIVNGRFVVRDATLVAGERAVEDKLADHRRIAQRMQAPQ